MSDATRATVERTLVRAFVAAGYLPTAVKPEVIQNALRSASDIWSLVPGRLANLSTLVARSQAARAMMRLAVVDVAIRVAAIRQLSFGPPPKDAELIPTVTAEAATDPQRIPQMLRSARARIIAPSRGKGRSRDPLTSIKLADDAASGRTRPSPASIAKIASELAGTNRELAAVWGLRLRWHFAMRTLVGVVAREIGPDDARDCALAFDRFEAFAGAQLVGSDERALVTLVQQGARAVEAGPIIDGLASQEARACRLEWSHDVRGSRTDWFLRVLMPTPPAERLIRSTAIPIPPQEDLVETFILATASPETVAVAMRTLVARAFGNGQFDVAAQLLKIVSESAPSPEVMLETALMLGAAGRDDEALGYLGAIPADDPLKEPAAALACVFLVRLGHAPVALALFERITERPPQLELWRAKALLAVGERAQALGIVQAALEHLPRCAEAYRLAADCCDGLAGKRVLRNRYLRRAKLLVD